MQFVPAGCVLSDDVTLRHTTRKNASDETTTLASVDEGTAAAFVSPIKLPFDDLVEESEEDE